MTYEERLTYYREVLTELLKLEPVPIIRDISLKPTRGGGVEKYYRMVCNGCGVQFETNRKHALWHDSTCSKRVSRSRVELKLLLQKAIEQLERAEVSQKSNKSRT